MKTYCLILLLTTATAMTTTQAAPSKAPAVTSTQTKAKPATAQEPITIGMDDIREIAIPKLRQEKLQMKEVAEHINTLATDQVRDSMEYAIVYEQYANNLKALRSHSCYKDERTVEVPAVKMPTANAIGLLADERAKLAKEQEEREHKEKLLALQEEQKKKQETIIAGQELQLEAQATQIKVANEQIRQTEQLRQEVSFQNRQLGRQMEVLNHHASNRNSLLYQQNQELHKANRFIKYGF